MATKPDVTMDIGEVMDWFDHRPINKKMRAIVAQFLRDRLAFVGVEWTSSGATEARMLDYACGNGFLSQIFAPHVSSITAVDISPVMIEKYKANIEHFGPMHKDTTQAVVGNLLADPPEPENLPSDFHFITLGAALHSFPSAEDAVKRLAERLRPGGVLFVLDLLYEGELHSGKRPRGFTQDDLASMMNGAGLVDVGFEVLPEVLEVELLTEEVMRIRNFIARGVKK